MNTNFYDNGMPKNCCRCVYLYSVAERGENVYPHVFLEEYEKRWVNLLIIN